MRGRRDAEASDEGEGARCEEEVDIAVEEFIRL